ncbi:phosphoesterase RecJ-like protein [Herbihabitans rhizosphaerae]|uniref:Phosphoesterase RecJ-like protein n=1 Tax=Herbihabitans rhizosphaerae TaxID=1872711 RepID=A0A4Q7KCW6_9PSEU|nr:bifunctional oligoribonuclease/PAP phosphatase NrnA [Herbihabitans rhizosphaerae]RZS30495.1 phosphoesterase RecJ-like protein [Herbihabitans rhizosphaerae]
MTGVDAREAAELLRAATDVTLIAHVNPDADALGSALALGLGLHRRGVRVRVSFGAPREAPNSLRALDFEGLIVPVEEVPHAPELLVAVDCGSVDRLGGLADRVAAGGPVLVIDHHASNTRFGTHNLVDEHAEATVVLVLDVLDELGVVIDEPIARCLYAGLVTDTSSFRRARPRTHEIAARLLESGVDSDAVSRELMDTHSFAWLRMLSAVLGRAEFEPDAVGGLGWAHAVVRLSDMDGVRWEEVESVVDVVRTAAEAEVTSVLKQVAERRWSVSLRATSRVDVRMVANSLGGGGHRLAAGFTTDGSEQDVLAAIRAELRDPTLI